MKTKTRFIRLITFMSVIALVISLNGISVFAASKSTTASKAEKAAQQLSNCAEYEGWTVEKSKPITDGKKVVIFVSMHNSKHVFNKVNVIAKSGKKSAYYRFKGKKYTLKGWKRALKKWSVPADKKAMLKSKADKIGDEIQKYAKKNCWTVKRSTSYKNGVAAESFTFTNPEYKWKARVTVQRSKGAIRVRYTRDGKKSTKKAIKEWLSKYSVGEAEVDAPDLEVPPAPTDNKAETDTTDTTDSTSESVAPEFSGQNHDIIDVISGEPTPEP